MNHTYAAGVVSDLSVSMGSAAAAAAAGTSVLLPSAAAAALSASSQPSGWGSFPCGGGVGGVSGAAGFAGFGFVIIGLQTLFGKIMYYEKEIMN